MSIPTIQGHQLVRRRSMPTNQWYWERYISTPSLVYLIPMVDGILYVHKFVIVPSTEVFRGLTDDENRASKGILSRAAE